MVYLLVSNHDRAVVMLNSLVCTSFKSSLKLYNFKLNCERDFSRSVASCFKEKESKHHGRHFFGTNGHTRELH